MVACGGVWPREDSECRSCIIRAMKIRSACAALTMLLAAGCATTENTGIPEPTPAPSGEEVAAVAPDEPMETGPDGNPMPETVTGADPGLEGNDPAWKSGMSATALTQPVPPAAHADSGPVATPTRDGQAHRYELRAYGTDVEVYMDGQPVPADRVRMHANQVGVLDANGTVIERLDLPANWTEDAQKATTPSAGDPFDFRDVAGNKLVPPKVMLGGRLVEPTTAVLKHLGDRGVNRDRASMVTNVIPELPLALAGIENDDIILAVNEVPDADPATIRAVLRTMKPGDAVTFRVLRGKQVMDVRVIASAWEAQHMVRPLGTGGAGVSTHGAAAPSATPSVAELEESLAQAKMRIAALERQLNERDPARKAIRPQPVPAPTVQKPK